MRCFTLWVKVNDEWITNEVIIEKDTVTMRQWSWIDWAKWSGYLVCLGNRGKQKCQLGGEDGKKFME